ncbi:MAG: hypothetical protein JWP95_355, partial [Actinotalea sp.]|nr:hypothetical protein [Actinotalea sp.]
MQGSPALRRLLATTTVAATVAALSLVSVAIAPAAVADTAPASPGLPTTVTTDPLPTVQINGVVWNQQIVGGTVYVAGNFTSARPAGSPAGTGEVPRTHLLAYDLATGVLVPGFAPVLNGQVKDLAVSPDQRTLYVGGQFTTVDGANRYRAAAFDVATGTLVAGFRPTINATVNAISATSTTVFLGGNFTTVNGQTRTNAAAVTVDTGATTPFAVSLVDGTVNALTIAPDGASVVIGGSFTSANGSTNPGYGLARLDASTGASLPLPVNTQVRDAGTESAIVSLETDGQNFYGTGYHYGRAGNVEGTFSADWATGSLTWVEDCHGDTYSAFPIGDVIYQASHKHYCGNSGGFPQTEPWTFHRGTAVSRAATGVNAPDIYGYPDHAGQASPTLLHWFPDINAGTFTGLSQGPWTVSGNASYVLMGGEFTTVGGVPQQGLVRFATSAIAPDSQGPQLADAAFPLVATPDGTGSVRLTWRTNQDPDNQTLTYKLYRSTQTSAPIYETTVTAPFWQPQGMSFSDSGLPAGSSQRYRLAAVDAFGNQALSAWVTVDLTATGTPSAYAQEVLDDRPLMYWRLGEASGSAVLDRTGFEPATASSGVTRGAADALTNDADTATTFSGTTSGYAADPVGTNAPDTFTLESWVRTTSTRGGKIVGFGNRSTGTSTVADRHLYIDNQGRLHFGVQGAAIQDLATGTGFNNGVWHHVVGTYEAGTMTLYVDGVQRAQRTDVAYERSYWGFWRIGGDRLNGWPNRPTSDNLGGTLEEVAVYPYALSGAAVAEHHRVGTTGAAANREPVAAFV